MGQLLRAVAIVNWVARMYSNNRERERERELSERVLCSTRDKNTLRTRTDQCRRESCVLREENLFLYKHMHSRNLEEDFFCVDIKNEESIKFY